MAYLERGGLEKQRGGPPRSTYSRGNVPSISTKYYYATVQILITQYQSLNSG